MVGRYLHLPKLPTFIISKQKVVYKAFYNASVLASFFLRAYEGVNYIRKSQNCIFVCFNSCLFFVFFGGLIGFIEQFMNWAAPHLAIQRGSLLFTFCILKKEEFLRFSTFHSSTSSHFSLAPNK